MFLLLHQTSTSHTFCNSTLPPIFIVQEQLALSVTEHVTKTEGSGDEYSLGEGTWINFHWVCATGLSKLLTHYIVFCGQL